LHVWIHSPPSFGQNAVRKQVEMRGVWSSECAVRMSVFLVVPRILKGIPLFKVKMMYLIAEIHTRNASPDLNVTHTVLVGGENRLCLPMSQVSALGVKRNTYLNKIRTITVIINATSVESCPSTLPAKSRNKCKCCYCGSTFCRRRTKRHLEHADITLNGKDLEMMVNFCKRYI